MAKEEFNNRIVVLQGKITNYDQMKQRVASSWLVWFSGLRQPLLFFFQCYEQWQQSRNQMFKDLAQGNESAAAETIRYLKSHRDALEASNSIYLKRAIDAENKLKALVRNPDGTYSYYPVDKSSPEVHDGGAV